jgi:hypothetical protein
MSFRRLCVLVDGLPQDSNVARARHGEAAEWYQTDRLLATLINDFRSANSAKKITADQLIYPPGESPVEVAQARLQERGQKVGGAKELDALFTGGG